MKRQAAQHVCYYSICCGPQTARYAAITEVIYRDGGGVLSPRRGVPGTSLNICIYTLRLSALLVPVFILQSHPVFDYSPLKRNRAPLVLLLRFRGAGDPFSVLSGSQVVKWNPLHR